MGDPAGELRFIAAFLFLLDQVGERNVARWSSAAAPGAYVELRVVVARNS